ncbi:MAG: Ig-like domain repeat protein [Candidatus Acidiferrales bacterium]
MIPARGLTELQRSANVAKGRASAPSSARFAALWLSVFRSALAAFLALIALSLAATASAQIPPKTIFAGQFPNAVAVNPVTNKIYIANSGSNDVTVVDGATNTVSTINDTHATSPVAIAVNSLTNVVYVANNGSNNVSVFSGAIGSTPAAYVTTITNGNGLGPSAIAVDANLNQVYVANSTSGNITIINGATNAITATRASGTTPSAVAVNSATGFFYVANAGDNTVAIFNGNTNVIAGSASMGSGATPFAIAVNEATDQVYVSNNGTNTVIQIDGGTQAITGGPISNGNALGLQGIAVNPVTNQIFVAANSGNTLVINGPGNSTAIVNDQNASGGIGITVDSITNTVYVANFNGTVTEFNGSNPSTVFNFATGGSTQAIAVNPATHRAYAACNLSNGAFTVIDGAALIPTTITPTDSAPVAIGVNPVTNLIYVANSGDNDVTVINGATNTIQGNAIGVGNTPTAIAVDPIRNQIYVLNSGDDFVTDIDGASGNTAQITDGDASGLTSITFNPVTNTGFFTGATSQTLTSFTTIFGVSTSTGDQSLTGFASHPGPIAINPSNGQLFILDNFDSSYTVLDAVTSNSVTNGGTLGGFTAIAINPVTNFAYIAGPDGVLVVNGSDLSSNALSDTNALGPIAIAVNPVTNLVYVANSPSNNVSVFQGATATSPASYLATVTDSFANNPQAIAVNPATNKIYVVNSGSHTVTVIDGVTNGELSIPVGNNPVAAGVNPITNEGYIVNRDDSTVTAIAENQPQTNNIQTNITPLTGNASSTTTPTFTFSATNELSEKTPPPSTTFAPIAQIYYQVDTLQETWTPTKAQSGFSATLAPLTPGVHTLYAFATDGEDSTSTISGVQSGPTVGAIASYQFLVAPEIGQFFALFGPSQDFGSQAQGVPSTAKAVTLENEGGFPMNFTFALGGANASDFTLTTGSGTLCNQLGGLLPANSQCNFWFTFQPSTLGAESATLTATDTTTGTPVDLPVFNLTGSGVPQLSVNISGNGTGSVSDGVSFTCGTGTCTTTYAANSNVTLTATPHAGSSFVGWSGDCAGASTCSLTMNQSHTVTATFTAGGNTLSIGEAGTGTGTVSSNPGGIACQPTCSALFSTGQQVTLTATANPGSVFTGWSGGGCSGTGTCIVTMSSAQTVIATFTLTGATACPATGTTNWITHGNGNWSVGSNWSTGNPPVSGAIVCIANGISPVTVTVDTNPSVGGLYIDAGNTVSISANQALQVAGTVSNSGTIILNVTTGNNVVLQINNAVTLTGGGTVTLLKGSSGTPILNNTNAGALTNVNNTIQGAGQLGNNGLILTNQAAGVINANDPGSNALLINANNVTNQGLMEATATGVLQFNVAVINQNANIKAIGNNASVELFNGTAIRGGTLTNSGSTFETASSNAATLDGASQGPLTLAGTYTQQLNSTTVLVGTINNTGTLLLNVTDGNNVVLQINNAVTLTGGGTVTLSKGSSGTPILNNTNAGALTNVNNLIQGAGQIGNNGLIFTNQAAGVINANDPNSNALLINAVNVTNQGLMEATGAGVLQFNVAVSNQNANIKAIANNASVELFNGTAIRGGTLTNAGGTFETAASNSVTLDGASQGPLTLVGTYTEQLNSTTQLVGTINNTGTFFLNVTDGNNVVLQMNSTVTLTGGGTVLMQKGSSGTPILNNTNAGSLVNVNNLIEGAGQIGNNGLGFNNQAAGVVNANDVNGNALLINASNALNQGLLEATGAGVLEFNVAVVNQGANIEAIGNNAFVELFNGTAIRGGTLTNAGGTVETVASNGVTLDGSTDGPFTLVGTYTEQLNSTTILVGTINNTGTFFMNVTDGNNVVLQMNSTVTLTGGGTVTMSKGSTGTPVLNNTNGGALVNVNNLIQGAGQIGNNGLGFTNQAAGVINANDVNGNALLINANAATNHGLIEATGAGVLEFNVAVVNAGANIEAIGHSAFVELFSGATIRGGTLTNAGGTFETVASNGVTLDGATQGQLTLVGTYTEQLNSTTQLVGTINNTGTFFLNVTDGNNVVLQMNSTVMLTGGGTVTMSKGSTGTPVLNNTNAGSLVNVNNLIQGAGQIGNNGLGLTNQAAGVINANQAGNTLTINPGGTFNNAGLVESTGTGVLQMTASVDNSGTILVGGSPAPGTVNITNYTQESTGAYDAVLGGTTTSTQYSVLTVNNPPTLNGALNLIFANGFVPSVGNSFTILTAGSISGGFSSINSPAVPSGSAWSISYNGGHAVLSLIASSSLPQTLTVTDLGTGSGSVTDDLEQISCVDTAGVVTGTCFANYSMNSIVNLTAAPSGSSTFSGWGGACSGTGACSVTMGSAQSVTASFTPTPTSINLTFPPSNTPQTQEAIFNCPSNTNPCTDQNAHAVAITIPAVSSQFTITVLATEVPPAQADGICETGDNVTNDFDCRFVTFFPGPAVSNGQKEPLCDPYANGNCVHYLVFSGQAGTEPDPNSYTGPVSWKITWNNESFAPPAGYQVPPRLFDDPDAPVSDTSPYGTNCTTPMLVGITNPQQETFSCQFEFDITTFFDAAEQVDSGIGGTTRQFNDVVVAFPLTIAAPNLSATKTADAATANVGDTVGFTISVSNSTAGGTATANNVALSDALPGGAGTNWSISPAYAGPGTCNITGAAGAQTLGCSFGNLSPAIGASVHVSSVTSSSATLQNTATITADNNATLNPSATITLGSGLLTPAFSNLTPSQSIPVGTPNISLSGTISSGTNFPQAGELVSVTINSTTVNASIGSNGNFSTIFQTSSIPASATPYTITYSYAGDSTFTSASDSSTTLTVNATQTFTVNVSELGNGSGTITSDVGGIDCVDTLGVVTGTCSMSYAVGTPVILTETPGAQSEFAGWGGVCTTSGTATTCSLNVNDTLDVTAAFTLTQLDLTFAPSATPQTVMATFGCPSNPNPTPQNPCTDPNAHAVALTIPAVTSQFTVTVQALLTTGDGICETGNNVGNDFDCRFVSFFPGPAVSNGQKEPICDPYDGGSCVHYLVYAAGAPGTEPDPSSYTGPVSWKVTWNNDASFTPPAGYQATPRLFDDPDSPVSDTAAYGTNCTSPMLMGISNPTAIVPNIFCQFEFDITTFFDSTEPVDSGIGGTTRQFNDVVVAFPLTVATPNLTATKTADSPSVTAGSSVGYTISVSNSSAGSTGTANNVALSDPLPGNPPLNWSISPAYSGPGTCSITGETGGQTLACSFGALAPAIGASVHVTSGTSGSTVGTLQNTATITADNNATLTPSASIVVSPSVLTASFSNLTPSQTITAGTASISLSGVISAGGTSFPPTSESVTITIDGFNTTVPIGANGLFSATFQTSAIPASATPYPITYSYAGDTNFTSASDSSTTLTVNRAQQFVQLSVTLMGTGTGSVSDNDGIECQEANGVTSGTCAGNVPVPVTLVATATAPSTFAGWGGACAGSGSSTSCLLTSGGTAQVTANFLPPAATTPVTFNPGNNVMQTATFDCPTNDNPCTSQSAHSLQLMIPQVNSQFTMTVQATEVPPNSANGDCSPGHSVSPDATFDFDCRFSTFFGFGSAQDGGKSTPLCDPYANGNCVHYLVYFGTPGTEPPTSAYSGDVQWFITWNDDTFVPPAGYTGPPRLYDDPDYAVTPQSAVGSDCTRPMTINGVAQTYSCQFEYDITTLFVPGQTVDSGIGGTTRQFNDVVVAFPSANVPQLTATSAPDSSTPLPLDSPIGFTVTVTNSGASSAQGVNVNDPLPTGTGVVWSLASPVSGCSVTGTAPAQVLSCINVTVAPGTPLVLHVTTPTAGAGTYTNAAAVTLNAQQLLTIAIQVVNQAAPQFSNLTPSQAITFGMSPISLSGTISAGANLPPSTESVSITINGVTVSAPIGAGGNFSASFSTATIPASTTPYAITYFYAGDTDFASATDSSTTLTVNKANQTISLTGAPASAAYNSSFTISATATSNLTVSVVATGACSISGSTVTMTSGTGVCTLTANQAGNGNFNAAPQVVVTVNATKATSTTTITSTSPNPSTPGQSVTANFKVTGNGTPTGSVTVTATLPGSSNVTCTGTLSNGMGSCSMVLGTAGSWTLTAVYTGDNNFTGSTSASVTQTVAAAASTLKFSPPAVNFGTDFAGSSDFANLMVTNTGSSMVTFTNFNIVPVPGADSNGFFGISFCPRTLNAGRSCTIILVFIADFNVTKPHAATLVVTDNAPGSPQTVPLSATVINPFARLSSSNLNFGRQKVGTTSAPQMVTLTSAGTTPLTISNLKITGDYAFAGGTCANNQTLAPGAKCNIFVTFTPSRSGERDGDVFIFDNAENSPSNVDLDGSGK